ncbi:hypothetical protein V500_05403 [Pseudogymnoascus sp. VKM F-4518 (FW-2643)]|nr:hypothetical protein V500_05403 [Pseudogymnoascus sp. VKM F-4518 (FW-2643)]
MASSRFHIRETCDVSADSAFILDAFDASLAHLESIGSGAQWGAEPFSASADRVKSATGVVTAAEAYRLNSAAGDPVRLFIAEVGVEDGEGDGSNSGSLDGLRVRTGDGGARFLAVAAGSVRERWWPAYVSTPPHLAPVVARAKAEGNPFYLEMLISDFRTGASRKGSGAALVRRIREYAVAKGATSLFVDCWAGNDGNLAKFYVSQGFVPAGDFIAEKPGKDPWPGKLLRMDIS